jgi:hypothetical protein
MLNRYIRFFKKSGAELHRLIARKIGMLGALAFYFRGVNFSSTYLSYKPDSLLHFGRHNEYYDLFKSFTKHNKFNNAGDAPRLWSFILNIKQILSEDVPGDFAELGVWRGNTASVLAHYADISNRKLYLFDTFEGFDSRDLGGVDKDKQMAFADTSLPMVKNVIGNSSSVCRFAKGYFPSTITEEHDANIYSIVSLDCDLYEPMKSGLDFFYPRMSKGGILFLHDYSSNFWDGAKKAVDEFCAKNEEYIILIPDKSGSAFVRKTK